MLGRTVSFVKKIQRQTTNKIKFAAVPEKEMNEYLTKDTKY